MAKDLIVKKRLERVTGPARRPAAPARPPSASPQPAAKLDAPLPVGSVRRLLTPTEDATLAEIGWQEGDPIPGNLADIIAQVRAEQGNEPVPLPVPLDTPPLQVDIVPEEQLSPQQRERVRALARGALAQAQQQQQTAQLPDSVQVALRGIQWDESELQEILAERTPPTAAPAAPAPASGGQPRPVRQPSQPAQPTQPTQPRPIRQPTQPQPPRSAQAPEPVAEPVMHSHEVPRAAVAAATPSETGADQLQTHCPHCYWDLTMVDGVEPTRDDEVAWLHCFLGQKPFTKDYPILGGAITLTFRSLTLREIDLCFKQTVLEQERGLVSPGGPFWERANRLRVYASLQRVRSDRFDHDLPEGLTEETNPHAGSHWQVEEVDPDNTILVAVESYILDNILRTESFARIVVQTCREFNRLVAKLEALADNPDFRPGQERSA